MALTATERLILVLNLENRGAIAGLEATGAAARTNLGAVEAGSAAASTRLAAVGAAGVAVGALVGKGIKSAYDAVDGTARQALRLQRVTGETAENASALAYAAQQTGVPVEKLATGIGILSTKSEKLKDIGVSFRDADGAARPFLDVLEDIADRVSGLDNGAEKNALVRSLFGRGGAELIPLLNKGRDGIEAMKKAAASQGLLLNQATLDDIKANIIATRELSAAWQGLKIQFGNAVVPAVTEGLGAMASAAKTVASAVEKIPGLSTLLADAALVGGAFAVIGGGASLLAAAGSKVRAGWGQVATLFGAVRQAEAGVAEESLLIAAANDKATVSAERLAVAQRGAAEVAAAPALSAAAAGEIGVLAGGALTGKAATRRQAEATLKSTGDAYASATPEAQFYAGAVAAAAEAEATAAAEAALLKTEVSGGVGVAMEGAAAKSKVAGDEMVVGATRGAGAWSALKGILGKGLTAAIAIDVGFDIVNQITGVDEDARKAMTHFAASLGKGNDDVIRAFSEGNVEVERETMKWGHLITVFTDNAFKLGGVGPERNVSDIKAAFDAVLNQQGPEAAQKLVDAVKAQSSALSENDTNRVQSISLAKQWQRAIDDATAAQKANTGAVDDGAKAYGRFNQELDPDKTRIANYVSGLSEVSSMVGSVMDAEGNLSDARRRYADAQTALAGGGDGSDAERALEAADASSAAAAASRAEASARLQLEAANRRVAAAQALVDHAPTEAARAAAVDQLSAAENDRANALDRVADAQDQATASSRALHQAQADEYSTASRLADANDRLAAAKRGVQAANRELLNAERDLALAEAELAHIDPRRDPNRFREKSAQVADLRDARANAVDRVADAQDSVSSAQRGIVQAHLDAAVAKDEERQKTEDLAKAGDDLVTALIAEQQKLGELYDYIQSHPDAIPQLEQQIRDWAEAGLISVSVADAWIGRLESLRQKATETGDALERVLIGQENLTAAGVGFIQGNGGNIAQSGIGGRPGYGGIPADVWDGGRKPNSVPKSGKGGTLGQGAYAASLPVDRNGNPIFNPSRGETGTMGGRTYVWTGASWEPKAGGRATGGAVQAGRFYEVGERGFELFDMGSGRVGMIPGRDGTVQPHEAAVAALQGGTSNGRLLSSLPPASAPSGGDGMTREQAAELIALLKAGASRPIDVALDMRGQAVVPSASEVTRGVRAALWQSGVG